MHAMALKNPNMRGLLCRKTATSLTSTGLVTYRETVAKEALASGEVKYYGGSSQEAACYKYKNGAVLVIGGLDRATRIMSSEYDVIYVQEATELTQDDWEALTTRLRNGRVTFQQLMADCNPGPPTHWLKQRCDGGTTRMLYSKHEDNPSLYNAETGEWSPKGESYLAKLDSLTGVRYERFRWGKWAAADGLVYDTWDPAVHLIDRFPVQRDWNRWWSVDFGYNNPTVIQMWAEDPDGRLYLYREIYRTQTIVEDHAAVLAGYLKSEPQPRAIVCDHDAEDRATLERKLGCATIPAHKSVLQGIEAVKVRLNRAGDGRPRLFIMRDAVIERDASLADERKPTCTADEVLSYVWGPGTVKEAPLKRDDHGMDAMRYVVAHLDLHGVYKVRVLRR